MSYTPEITKYIVEKYQQSPNRETVDILAYELAKPYRSIISKLSKEGVYRREVYKTKRGEIPITKAELVEMISDLLVIDSDNLAGLDKSPKPVLQLILVSMEHIIATS